MLDRVRLAQICEMMRSENDNERAVAARMATEMLKRLRMSWTDLKVGSAPPPQQSDGPPDSPPTTRPPRPKKPPDKPARIRKYEGVDGQELVADLLCNSGLSTWETMFLKALSQQGAALGFTERQWRVLRDVALRHRRWSG